LTGLALATALALVTPLEAPASVACFEAGAPPTGKDTALTLSADLITLDGDTLDARAVVLSGCACAGQTWRVRAARLHGERDAWARVDWPVLYLGPIPVAASPVWWVPLGERVPGLLFPRARLRSHGALAVEQPVFVPLGRAADLTPSLGFDSARGVLGGVTTRWRTAQSNDRVETLNALSDRHGAAVTGDAALSIGTASLAARGETALGQAATARALLPLSVITQPRLSAEVAVTRGTDTTQAALGVTRIVTQPHASEPGAQRHILQAAASATTPVAGGRGRVDAALVVDAEGAHRAAQLTGTFDRPTRVGLMRWTPTGVSQVVGDAHAAMQASVSGHLLGELSAVGSPVGLRHRLTAFGGASAGATSPTRAREAAPWRSLATERRGFLGLAQRLAAPRSDAALDFDLWWDTRGAPSLENGAGGQARVSTATATLNVVGGPRAAHARAQVTWQPLTVGASYLWSRAGANRPETLDPRATTPWLAESDLALSGGSLELGVTTQRWRARYTIAGDTLAERAQVEVQSASLTWNAACECLSIGAAVEHSRGLAAPDVRLSLSGGI